MRRVAAVLVLSIVLLAAAGSQQAWAHAALVGADPAPGASLADPPQTIQLTFSERSEPSSSEVRVLDARDATVQSGATVETGTDQFSLEVPLGPLDRGTYTVDWRVVSAVDGHATAGKYSFGVGGAPAGSAAVTTSASPASSWLEVVARWVFLIGLVVLLGASTAAVARFGGAGGTDLRLAASGLGAGLLGVLLLAEAQRRTASSSFGDLFDTDTGHALVWRALALAAAGAALLLARRATRIRRGALLVAALAAVAAVAVHVGAGHAAAGPWSSALTISAQTAHFAAAGVWFGGLAALLLGLRGGPPAGKAAAVSRFAIVAAAALAVVVATGTLRAIDELSSIGDLISSGYGRAVLAKIVLVAIIAGLAARNRRRVKGAADELRPLRRGSGVELALAVVALAVAALLGTLAPPAPAEPVTPPGLAASGTDAGSTVEVQLTAAATDPGPNRFTVEISDSGSEDPVEARRVSLRFTPLDDPGVRPTSLALHPAADASWVGSGSNLTFDGRWAVSVLIHTDDDVLEVPLQLDVPGPDYFVSVERIPGAPPKYTMQIGSIGYIRIEPDPELPGPSEVRITCYTAFESVSKVKELVLTAAAADGPTLQQTVRRLGAGRFVAPVDLEAGPYAITVTALTPDGTRLRGEFHLQIPGD